MEKKDGDVMRIWVLVFVMMMGSLSAMAYEEARYAVVQKDGDFEVRDYAPVVVAEARVSDTSRSGDNSAFRLLFAYIGGANRGAEKVAMTVPVTTATEGQKIAMTVPVTTEGTAGENVMRFVMPAGRTLSDLPVPTDPRVVLRELKGERVATVRFSGFGRDAAMDEQEAKLRAWAEAKGLALAQGRREVFYNSPFTLPWWRRNEVWVKVGK